MSFCKNERVLAIFAWKYNKVLYQLPSEIIREICSFLYPFFEGFTEKKINTTFWNEKLAKVESNLLSVVEDGYYRRYVTGAGLQLVNTWTTLSLTKMKFQTPFVLDFKCRLNQITAGYESKFHPTGWIVFRFNKKNLRYEGMSPWGFTACGPSMIRPDKKWHNIRMIFEEKEMTLYEDKEKICKKPYEKYHSGKKKLLKDGILKEVELTFNFQLYDLRSHVSFDITDIGIFHSRELKKT